ncbi:hypothetical protein NDK43_26100 [Neobacillus pocheonensis]|uniref:Uncharacterized protein n=1 Tax=Neobacillus pocheonensis TaxID=363869 RepID=A0ABT0WFT9_9BACI|nr:hypothetical protein [Neobacillus pocheonensis]
MDDSPNERERKRREASERKKILDYSLGIDTVVKAKASFQDIKGEATHTFQERCVTRYYNNVCIRLTNEEGRPFEFFKMTALHFLYMIVKDKELQRWIWIPHISKVIESLKNGALKYDLIDGEYQSKMIGIKTKDLKRLVQR